MASLINSVYTGASGIYASQTAVQVTGNNIANVNSEGYSRQTANITSSGSLSQGGLQFGTGSLVNTVDRAGDPFIIKQLVARSATYGEFEASSEPLSDIEQILDISDSGLASDIDAFFDAWQALADNPNSTTQRQQVLMEAEDLAYHFQQIDQQLSEVVDSLNSSIEAEVPDLNDMLVQIASLNQSIMSAEAGGGDANTLRDQRDLLVQQVSETCGATTYNDENGMVCLQLTNGLPLVTGATASEFTIERVDGLSQLTLNSGQSSFALDAGDVGGSLKGMLQVRDEVIPEMQDDIDRLAYELASAVNSLHTTGLDQDGNSGTELFSLSAPTDPTADAWQGAAASIVVTIDDPTLLCAGTTGATGDNSLSLAIAQLADEGVIDGSTFSQEYGRIAAKAGLLVASNEAKFTAAAEALNETQEDRDALAGVSTDEEMVLLIQYQAGYEAASNYLGVVKEMLDTLMAM